MQLSRIQVLILRDHLFAIIISVAFIGLALFIWLTMGNTANSDLGLFGGAVLLVAGALVFLFATKSIWKNYRRRKRHS